jgi:hypothetical protein
VPGGGQGRDGVQKLYVNPQMRDNIGKVHWLKVWHNDVSQRHLSTVLTSTSMPLTTSMCHSSPTPAGLPPDSLTRRPVPPRLHSSSWPRLPLVQTKGALESLSNTNTLGRRLLLCAHPSTLSPLVLSLSLSLSLARSLSPTPPRPSILRFNDLGHPAPCQPLPAPSTS